MTDGTAPDLKLLNVNLTIPFETRLSIKTE